MKLIAATTRKDAITAALDGYDNATAYVTATRTAVQQAEQTATADLATADSADFAADLAAIQTALARLEPVTPRLSSDNSIDYYGLATSTALSNVAIGNLLDHDTNSFSGDLTAPFVLDFGSGFRVQADAFGLQARYNFANRSQGANVYGSNDGRTWTLLTSRETTDTSDDNFAMEKIPVRPDVEGKAYRFVKVQVDDPGPAADPAYPGLSSFGEFHIFGQRIEMVQALSTVSIASDGTDPSIAQNGDTITLTMTADQPIAELTAHIEGMDAKVTSTDDERWTASVTLPDDSAYGRAAQFVVDYTTKSGVSGATVLATTDKSSVQLWNSHVHQLQVQQDWVVASSNAFPGTGTPEANGWRMFDGDVATFTDTTSSNGWVRVSPTDGSTLTVSAVRIRPRASLPTRANGSQIQGSNDGWTTWKTLTTITGVGTGDAWYVYQFPTTGTYQQLRVYDGHGGYTNLAEVQLLTTS
ncbi:MAG TPA: discoidin domain-containing protein [Microlunatus sp.]|nr:discoidin domain-containing protein [Microlunatus sp.]